MTNPFTLNWKLIFPLTIIFGFSLTALSSISSTLAITQLVFFLISALFFYLFSVFRYKDHQGFLKIYALGSTLLLTLPFLFGAVTRGSVRWIQIGSYTLQPSEIIKPFLILIFAHFLSFQKGKSFNQFLIYLGLLILPALLIFKQPDLGSTLVIIFTWFSILIASNLSSFYPLSLLALALISSPLALKLLRPYQAQRITSFLNPYFDPKGSGYQIIQSTIAIGSGRIFGKGLGAGSQSQLQFLPERHTDFIFASLSEEIGFFATSLLIIAYFFLLKEILLIAKKAPDQFSYLITLGVFSMLLFQSSINIAMNLGVMPVTGITLPLVSAGGSSLIATMISLGLVHNISQHTTSKKGLEIK